MENPGTGEVGRGAGPFTSRLGGEAAYSRGWGVLGLAKIGGRPNLLGSGATVAQLTLDQKVEGSNPSSPAISILALARLARRLEGRWAAPAQLQTPTESRSVPRRLDRTRHLVLAPGVEGVVQRGLEGDLAVILFAMDHREAMGDGLESCRLGRDSQVG